MPKLLAKRVNATDFRGDSKWKAGEINYPCDTAK